MSGQPSDRVHVQVDPHICVGVGVCADLDPTVFEYDEFEGLAVVRETVPLTRAEAQAAVDVCPSGAISIIEDGNNR